MGNYSADLAWQPPAETGGLSGLYYEAGDAREMVGDVGEIIRTFHGNYGKILQKMGHEIPWDHYNTGNPINQPV